MSDTTNAVEPGTAVSSQISHNTEPLPTESDNSNTTGNVGVSADPNSVETPPFDLAEPFDLRMFARGRRGNIPVRHVINQPSLSDLITRDAAQPYRTQMVNDDIERPITDLKNNADVKLYDKLIKLTEGYKLNVIEGQTLEERKAALEAIPKAHKQNVISQILPVDTTYVPEPISDGEDTEVYQWGENLTYKFAVEFGVNGQFKVFITMKEPSDDHLDAYRGATHFEIEKGGNRKPITRMTVDLKPAVIVFDELVESATGFVVAGEPFDVKNALHLKLVSGYLKRSVVAALVKQTQLDLGN